MPLICSTVNPILRAVATAPGCSSCMYTLGELTWANLSGASSVALRLPKSSSVNLMYRCSISGVSIVRVCRRSTRRALLDFILISLFVRSLTTLLSAASGLLALAIVNSTVAELISLSRLRIAFRLASSFLVERMLFLISSSVLLGKESGPRRFTLR